MNDTAQTTSEERQAELSQALEEAFGAKGCTLEHSCGQLTLVVPREHLSAVAGELRDGEAFRFEQLTDLCGADYSTYGQTEWDAENAPSSGFGRGVTRDVKSDLCSVTGGTETDGCSEERFAVIYHLLSLHYNRRLRLRVFVNTEQPIIASVFDIWRASDWFEREAFDLYGILFEGHPDLRRILTDYGFVGHPFRKDFPLEGHVEMRYDPELKRVVYEPVKIESRTLVPRVIRKDNRYASQEAEQQGGADA